MVINMPRATNQPLSVSWLVEVDAMTVAVIAAWVIPVAWIGTGVWVAPEVLTRTDVLGEPVGLGMELAVSDGC